MNNEKCILQKNSEKKIARTRSRITPIPTLMEKTTFVFFNLKKKKKIKKMNKYQNKKILIFKNTYTV